jgi:uncharacterized membrane protein
MELIRRSKGQLFLLLCSLVGAGIAIYLTFEHYQLVPLACSDNGLVNCSRVLSSTYSVIPGTTLPITIPGLAWCAVMAALAVVGIYAGLQRPWLRIAQFAWTLVGMLTVLYLVYVEIVRLRTICAWCTALHVLILLMFLVTLVQLQPQPPAELEADEEENEVVETAHNSRVPRAR